jgi:protein phosphatase
VGPVRFTVPDPSLILLMGPSGSGKSTFAERHFLPTEVLSSDALRAMVSDDPTNQNATTDAFDILHAVADKRLARGRLTVIDATNVQRESRLTLQKLASARRVPTVAIVFDLPEELCMERSTRRQDRRMRARVIRQHRTQLRRWIGWLDREGFVGIVVFRTPQEVESAEIERLPAGKDP